jgi:hypothetical protein
MDDDSCASCGDASNARWCSGCKAMVCSWCDDCEPSGIGYMDDDDYEE